MSAVSELIIYLDSLLKPQLFSDYAPNGLQVAGKSDVKYIVTGVSACQALIDEAIKLKADALLVHHGYFWQGENPCVTGIKHTRLRSLLEHDINLIAYHLPLDAHPEFGNNVQLAQRLNIVPDPKSPGCETDLLFTGSLTDSQSGDVFADSIAQALMRLPLHIPGRASTIKRIAWCTGGAQSYIESAQQKDVDAFLTGEVSEKTVHFARETGLHFFAAGHHATERYGVQALGEHLAERFGLQCEFVDIDNPA